MRQQPDAPPLHVELTRDLGLTSALSIGVGTMIAAGIFTLSGLAVGYVGSAAIVAFLAAAIVATFTALTYCEFSSIYPESGEGYLYARRTFPAPVAYLVGWALLLGYTSSCGFYIASLAAYFNEFIWRAPIEIIPGLVALALLTLLNIKGTKESGSFQVIITVAKVLLLCWFVAGGLGHVTVDMVVKKFSTDLVKIGSTAALVFITFFGFSAIAASAGEVKNPTRTIPRAIFLSMGIVTVLYTAVVLVIVAANLSEYTESAMGKAAKDFLGNIGGMVIVGGALFSMISASNASILAGSRVALSMAMRAHLPEGVGKISPRTKTPVRALLIVGSTIGVFAGVLPLEDLAHFADCVLLFALILVNAALVQHRRRYPHLRRPFRVPFVPVIPVLGMIANFYLLTRVPHILPVLLAFGALVIGFVGFLLWKGSQVKELDLPGEPSRVLIERGGSESAHFRVLVPVANPASVNQLIDLASAVAKPRDGAVVALRVVVEPRQLPPSAEDEYVQREHQILDIARTRAIARETAITSLVRIGRNAARAILETSRDRRCDLIVVGWKGHTSTGRRILGEVTDDVVRHARVDIMLAKLVSDELPRRLLLPTAGGVHARRAEIYAAQIARASDEGVLTLCAVLPPHANEEQLESEEARLASAKQEIIKQAAFERVETIILRNRSVSDGIIAESANHDAIVVGAAGQSFTSQVMFGSIPEEIAQRATRSVIVIKRHHAVKALFGRVMSE